jgi:hypothetical protein
MKSSALIYSHTLSPRLQYIVDFLSHYYGHSFRLTSNEKEYLESDCPCKINYSYHRLQAGEIWIHSHVLLFESTERPVKIECFLHNGYKVFFKTEGETGFDLLAAIFFLISRYEEYLPHHKDMYGRYAHENSIAHKESFLRQPLVNIWLEDFRILLKEKNEEFSKSASGFNFEPTYDIDMAWSYRNKGFKRNFGGIVLLLVKGKWQQLRQRIRVLKGKTPDPFDAYEWMDNLHKEHELHPLYFFLVAEHRSSHDKNISIKNPAFTSLIKRLDEKYFIGLHPSWESGDAPELLEREKHFLEELTGRHIESSRQHFIRFALPRTYKRLLRLGITNEYSMGYGSINGFRASIATPYFWYDLAEEAPTTLKIHPFCFMDANAYYEQKLLPEKGWEELLYYYETIKKVNGTLITVWHNSFLGSEPEFAGWREVYERFIKKISSK